MKNPELHYRGDLPYDSYTEYLDELCASMDIYLLEHVRKFGLPGTVQKAVGDAKPGPGVEDQCGLALEFLRRRLVGWGLEEKQDYHLWERMIGERRSFTLELGGELPLELLLERCGGDGFIRKVLILVLLGTLNGQYRALFEVTPAMCVRLFLLPDSGSEVRIHMAVQKYMVILCRIFPKLQLEADVANARLVCDARLTDILIGLNQYLPCGTTVYNSGGAETPALGGGAAAPAYDGGAETPVLGGGAAAPAYGGGAETPALGSGAAAPAYDGGEPPLFGRGALALRLEALVDHGITPVLLKAPAGAGKKHMLRYLARQKGLSLIFYDLAEGYLTDGDLEALKNHILYVARECCIYGHLMVLTSLERLAAGDMRQLTDWLGSTLCGRLPGLFLTADAEGDDAVPALELMTLEFPALDGEERAAAWEYFLRDCPLESGCSLAPVANAFVLTPGQICSSVRHAKLLTGGGPVDIRTLYHACYVQLDHQLAQKASRVQTAFGWEDLKLSPADKDVLRDVCNCVKNRHIVLDQWGFSRIVPYGGGITVLFAGPPGTGKTMAAQVIANELHMELYKIDLSQVIDKYVGETEKNIRMIFEQAKKSSSILFFDEADAIFNRRMEASNANERFANIESSLLLQCIEEYNGITILATNHFSAIDNAFVRRFKYYLLFKEPDADVRFEIWKSVFPKEAPRSSQVDLWELARTFEFTGAVIKNVALAAAYLAAQEQREILLVDILKAIRREMAKNNLILTREKLGDLCYMFDEMMADGSFEG